jgi:hypothetical protein
VTVLSSLLGGNRAFGRGYIDGLILSNGTDSDHDINIAAGECRDSTNTYNLVNAATLVKQIDASWAAGSAVGGLFSGSVANTTWYHVFLIRKDSDGSIDAGFDTSVTAANRPAGYSTYRRIGSVLTNGSANIIAFHQMGDHFLWMTPIFDINTTVGTSASLVTISTPLGVKTFPILNWTNIQKSAASPVGYLSSPDVTDGAVAVPYVSSQPYAAGENNTVTHQGNRLRTDTSSRIRARSDTASSSLAIMTAGWIDPRGKDA